MTQSYQTSDAVSERLARTQPLLIDGKWSAAEDGGASDVYNPSTGDVISAAAMATRADTERAIAAARASFDGGSWTGRTPAQRGKIRWQMLFQGTDRSKLRRLVWVVLHDVRHFEPDNRRAHVVVDVDPINML